MESSLSTTTLATTVTPLDPLARAEGSAATTAATSAEPATSWLMLGLWIRLGIVGVLVSAASLAAPLYSDAGIEALVGLAAGGVLTVGAWRRTRSILRAAGDASP